jgi:hypothetical protein
MNPPGLDLFLEGQEGYNHYLPPLPISPALLSTIRTSLVRTDIRLVVVDRSVKGAGAVIDLFTDLLGPPDISYGTFTAWASAHGAL